MGCVSPPRKNSPSRCVYTSRSRTPSPQRDYYIAPSPASPAVPWYSDQSGSNNFVYVEECQPAAWFMVPVVDAATYTCSPCEQPESDEFAPSIGSRGHPH